MDLSDALKKTRTYTPYFMENRDFVEPWTIDYNLLSLGDAKDLDGLKDADLDQEAAKHEGLTDVEGWRLLRPDMKHMLIMVVSHTSNVRGLTIDGKAVATTTALLKALSMGMCIQLVRELFVVINNANLGVSDAVKKSSSV